MNQLISLETIDIDNSQNWSANFGLLKNISEQFETEKILECLWDKLRGSGSSGYAYFFSSSASKTGLMSGGDIYHYGTACNRAEDMRQKYEQTIKASSKSIENLTSGFQKGSTISCPVFGPYNSKGLFIVHCSKFSEQILKTELETLNYVLLKSHIYIAEIEAKQRIESTALSKREVEVLEQMIKGESNKEIAQNLGVSVHTVNGYVRFLMLKLNVRDRVSACMAGLSILQ